MKYTKKLKSLNETLLPNEELEKNLKATDIKKQEEESSNRNIGNLTIEEKMSRIKNKYKKENLRNKETGQIEYSNEVDKTKKMFHLYKIIPQDYKLIMKKLREMKDANVYAFSVADRSLTKSR